jgi:hypothetical protein
LSEIWDSGHKASTSALGHGTLFEATPVLTLLSNLITHSTSTLPQYVFDSKPIYGGIEPRLHFILHSPLTLAFFDEQNNFTGSTATSTYFNVPGVEYQRFGEVQWLSVPKSMAGRVVMYGTGSGSFSLDVEEVNGNDVLATTTFAAVPSSTSTVASFVVNTVQSSTAQGVLAVDFDGNGSIDSVLQARQGAIVLPDSTPPITAVTSTGTMGLNNWYTSNVQVAFNATDTESGVSATYFSVDGNATSTGTTTVVTSEGAHVIAYFSTDNQGNSEMPHTLVIKIDKTTPEAKFTFNPITQLLDIKGIDIQSSTTVQITGASTLITDKAGHTLQITFTQPKLKDRRIAIAISSLKYDGVSTSSMATLKYKWKTDKNNAFTMFAAYAKTSVITTETHFRPKKDKTIIMQTPLDLDDSDDDDASDARPAKLVLPGLVIPFLTTDRGVVTVAW